MDGTEVGEGMAGASGQSCSSDPSGTQWVTPSHLNSNGIDTNWHWNRLSTVVVNDVDIFAADVDTFVVDLDTFAVDVDTFAVDVDTFAVDVNTFAVDVNTFVVDVNIFSDDINSSADDVDIVDIVDVSGVDVSVHHIKWKRIL